LLPKRLFDQYQFQTAYGEDLDLGIRLLKDGYQILFSPDHKVIHSHNRSAYYYLKRSFVETCAFQSILGTSLKPLHASPALVIAEILHLFAQAQQINSAINKLSFPVTHRDIHALFRAEFDHARIAHITRRPLSSKFTSPYSPAALSRFLNELSQLCPSVNFLKLAPIKAPLFFWKKHFNAFFYLNHVALTPTLARAYCDGLIKWCSLYAGHFLATSFACLPKNHAYAPFFSNMPLKLSKGI